VGCQQTSEVAIPAVRQRRNHRSEEESVVTGRKYLILERISHRTGREVLECEAAG